MSDALAEADSGTLEELDDDGEQLFSPPLVLSEPTRRKRNRDRDGAGKSEASWLKHSLIVQVANAQAHALHHGIHFRRGRGIIIDMHAGDGEGVEQPQVDMFGANPSRTTAQLAVQLARSIPSTDVVLCERDAGRRAALVECWPDIPILSDHADAPALVDGRYRWALVLNDPNGPKAHGIEHMQEIARRVRACDFVIAVNDGAVGRCQGVKDPKFHQGMSKYAWMRDWHEWALRLNRKQIAVSNLTSQSNGFRHRILVVANRMTPAVLRHRSFQVFQCK